MSARKRLPRVLVDCKGAVLAEFAIAIVPILMLFFCIAQLCVLGYTSLLVKHAAFVAVRAAAVVNPGMADSALGSNDVEQAAKLALAGVPGRISVASTAAAPMSQDMITTTVGLDFPCTVPLGGILVCGAVARHAMSASAAFPNQGAYSQAIWTSTASQGKPAKAGGS